MTDDSKTMPAPRFSVEFIGPDWFQIQGHPDARFLAPPPLTAEQLAEAAERSTWPEGWVEIGFTTEGLAFTREPLKSIDDWRWVVLSAYNPVKPVS